MGLRSTLQKVAQSALGAVGDLAKTVTYRSQASPSFNPTTGAVTENPTDVANVKAVFTQFSEVEIANNPAITRGDMKVLIARNDISGVTPKKGDEIIDGTDSWKVVEPGTDPAEALWVLQARI